MALLKIDSNYIETMQLKVALAPEDGVQVLYPDYLFMPIMWKEDMDELMSKYPENDGIVIKVAKINLINRAPVYHLIFVAIKKNSAGVHYDHQNDYVCLACPPTDRERDGQSQPKLITLECQAEISNFLRSSELSFSKADLDGYASIIDNQFPGFPDDIFIDGIIKLDRESFSILFNSNNLGMPSAFFLDEIFGPNNMKSKL